MRRSHNNPLRAELALKPIREVPEYAQAAAVLDDLQRAKAELEAEDARIQFAMSSRRSPAEADPVAKAVALLAGTTPPEVDTMESLQPRLNAVREKLEALRHAIPAQQQTVARIARKLGGDLCQELRPAWEGVGREIHAALTALHRAVTREFNFRWAVEDAGYPCDLPALRRDHIIDTEPHGMSAIWLKELESYLHLSPVVTSSTDATPAKPSAVSVAKRAIGRALGADAEPVHEYQGK